MSTKKMLIDATHPEETRVVVMSGNRLEEFDVESESRRQLKGNIYLAKIIRVEPSLQAAFVDYGGNRHGFLAFSEIHPDYYQIPIEDRQALLEEYKAAEIAEDSDEPSAEENIAEQSDKAEAGEAEVNVAEDPEAKKADAEENEDESDEDDDGDADENGIHDHRNARNAKNAKGVETVGGDDSEDARPRRKHLNYRRYKIQEVIKRRQILLVQVVKEERGNKGAALTTYVSLAGRYCVLMPNTARGGGISRKITNGADRKQLKAILSELSIPEGMAVIVRTAGIKRSRTEIKRDYEYLLRLWDSVRELTLDSMAPTLVHEEGNLIKRSIRDLYSRDVEDIVVAGDAGYRMAKDFIKLLIPSHAKRVQPYRDTTVPMFRQFQVEGQLDAIHSPEVHMRTGAYIVINPTEALVSIDVNSGRSTRERNIEETALKTNLEAADEIARQLRLRDLAGLIVIDFIDMEVSRNNGLVERRLKDAMRNDRARIQIGRISPFGLLELSRQRLRMSLIETSSEPCQYCEGTGIRRSTDSAALVALRAIEEEAIRKQASEFVIHVPTDVALYILNQKRSALTEIEGRCEVSITITADNELIPPNLKLERIKGDVREEVTREAGTMIIAGEDKPAKRRRRRSRNRKPAESDNAAATETGSEASDQPQQQAAQDTVQSEPGAEGEETGSKRRRRGKRGGRRRGGRGGNPVETSAANDDQQGPSEEADQPVVEETPTENAEQPEQETSGETEVKKPSRPRRRSRVRKTEDQPDQSNVETAAPEQDTKAADTPPEKPKRRPGRPRKKAEATPIATPASEIAVPVEVATSAVKEEPVEAAPEANSEAARTTVINIGDTQADVEEKKPRRGWWRRF